MMEEGHGNNREDPWFPRFGFYLGMIHGGMLNSQTNAVWPTVTTLVALCDEASDQLCTRLHDWPIEWTAFPFAKG
jgi:hypothetical protein